IYSGSFLAIGLIVKGLDEEKRRRPVRTSSAGRAQTQEAQAFPPGVMARRGVGARVVFFPMLTGRARACDAPNASPCAGKKKKAPDRSGALDCRWRTSGQRPLISFSLALLEKIATILRLNGGKRPKAGLASAAVGGGLNAGDCHLFSPSFSFVRGCFA